MSTRETVSVAVADRIVKLSNLDKVLWPDVGYAKADLIHYYATVASTLLPHLKDRPLTLTRYPDGINGKSFYQKNAPSHTPEWVRTYAAGEDKPIHYVLADEEATVVWLANQACVGIHTWLSTVHRPANPDQIVIDLDPNPPAGFDEARRIALVVRDVLDHMGLRGYPKLSGATGVHVYIPIVPDFSFAVASRLAGFVGRTISHLLPTEATNERAVHARGPRVYIDHLQNLPGQTMAAPYSVRPRPSATVSTPVTWEELPHCRPHDFTIKTVPERIKRYGDLFAHVLTDEQRIDTWVDELHLRPSDDEETF